MEYIELRVMKVVLIRVIIKKKVINNALKSEIYQLFKKNALKSEIYQLF